MFDYTTQIEIASDMQAMGFINLVATSLKNQTMLRDVEQTHMKWSQKFQVEVSGIILICQLRRMT